MSDTVIGILTSSTPTHGLCFGYGDGLLKSSTYA